MSITVDFLVVGAGFAGLVTAERLSNALGASCLVVDKRLHTGGNAHDRYDDHGVLIHSYGPHYFRTNSPRIRDYLGRFTEWHPVGYQIKSWSEGKYWPFPINLNTYEVLVGHPATEAEFIAYLEKSRVPIENPRNSEEVIVSQVGYELYEKFFRGYTLKQWRREPRELDASVCGRIPIRTNRDDRYLAESFQALPKAGYSRMFDRMLAGSPRVQLMLGTDYRDILPHVRCRHMIYTGPIDEFFDYRLGDLPYRSLRFEAESFTPEQLKPREIISGKPGFWQPAVQVNYPNDHAFTRIVEVKHATGQLCLNTTIVREYPDDYARGKEAYYPIPEPQAQAAYQAYKSLADTQPRVSFIGRLATYRYYNMDQVVGMALSEADRLIAGPLPAHDLITRI
jgi:UDP-galactopyranose mutase